LKGPQEKQKRGVMQKTCVPEENKRTKRKKNKKAGPENEIKKEVIADAKRGVKETLVQVKRKGKPKKKKQFLRKKQGGKKKNQ